VSSAVEADSTYLFRCGLRWKQGDATAGWQLLESLRHGSHIEKKIAAELLHAVAGVRWPRLTNVMNPPAGKLLSRTTPDHTAQLVFDKETMKSPYGLEITEDCSTCKHRQADWFCQLSPDLLKELNVHSHRGTFPDRALLFVEGQSPRGAFLLCSGQAKLFTTSRDGRVLILKMAQPGEILGLSAVIANTPYEISAETASACQVNFIARESLLRLVKQNGELGMQAAGTLSREFQSAYRDIHDLVMSRSSENKLAKLLLSWSNGEKSNEFRVRSSLTHEEMAQMIGSSRETVTRLLSSLKKKQVIRLEGSILVIRNRSALEALAA